jgi:PIN domain nuclease of toxin-antitoxin system
MQVNIGDAKRKLTELVVAAERGEDIVIAPGLRRAAVRLRRVHAVSVRHPHRLWGLDRVLIAHALQDALSVLTRDTMFTEYGVRLALTSV